MSKLEEILKNTTSRAMAEAIISDEETRKAIIAEAVSDALEFKNEEIRRQVSYAASAALKTAVETMIQEEMEKPEFREKIRAALMKHIDESIAALGASVPKLLMDILDKKISRW